MSGTIKIKAWHTVEERWATCEELLSEVPVSATVRGQELTIGGDNWLVFVVEEENNEYESK
jgi:hypothetical protein